MDYLGLQYLGYWGLCKRPFLHNEIDAFFSGSPQREASAGLNYFIASDWQLALLTAPPRCGMTWLLRYLKRMNGFGDCAAEVILTSGRQPSRGDAWLDLAVAMGIQPRRDSRPVFDDYGPAVQQAMDASARHQVHTVWLIDGARAPVIQLARDLMMANRQLSVVLGTRPGGYTPPDRGFLNSAMQVELTSLDLDDTAAYVRQGLDQPGVRTDLFSDAAIVRLHEMTGGVLADLANLAESALALAASHGLDIVTPSVVEAIEEQQRSRAA